MQSRVALTLGALLVAPALWAQAPLIYNRGIRNAAHGLPNGLPNGPVARGSVFSIFGVRLGPASSPALSFPLPATLGGVSIKITQGSTSVNAIPVFLSPGQINAIMPSNAPLGAAALTVTFNNATSPPGPVAIINSGFGIYTANGTGFGPGIFQNVNSETDRPINAPAIAAQPGQAIILWGTGLGPATFPDNVAPTPVSLPTPVEVFVGGKLAPIVYSGRSPCCSGTDQIVFNVPADAPTGCWVPVQVRTEKKIVGNTTTMAITSDGSPCSEPSNPLAAAILSGGKVANLELLRISNHRIYVSAAAVDISEDLALMNFRQYAAGTFPFQPRLSLPPVGTCTVLAGSGNLMGGTNLPGSPPAVDINGGAAFTVTTPKGSRQIAPSSAAKPTAAELGHNLPGLPVPNSQILDPGSSVTFSGAGGLQAAGTTPGALTWSNRDQIGNIDRSQPLTLSWTGGASAQLVEIAGGVTDIPTNSSAAFVCLALPGAGSFTIPPQILQSVPASNANPSRSSGNLMIGAISIVPFTMQGFDAGALTLANFSSKPVTMQ